MNLASVLRQVPGGTEIDIMVTPHAKTSGIQGVDEWRKRLLVKVQSLPLEGKANREVTERLSEIFGAEVIILRGETNRLKTVLVPLDRQMVVKRLEALL